MVAGIITAGPATAQSQTSASILARKPAQFEAWSPAALAEASGPRTFQPTASQGGSGRNALIGGAVGTVAGLTLCTVISNIAKDRGTGFSTCTVKGYFLFGGVGLVIGTIIGLGAPESQT